ncbi:hypothetical protein D3C78_1692660 [compost metagenome]
MYSVIQILCILAINRDDDLTSQIAPSLLCDLLFRYRVRRCLRLCHNLLRETLRKLVFTDNRQNIYAWIIFVSQNFDNFTFGC